MIKKRAKSGEDRMLIQLGGFVFSIGELAAIAGVLVFLIAVLICIAVYPTLNGSPSLGPDWDCAPNPYGLACVKRIPTPGR